MWTVEEWNAAYPPGTAVIYYPVLPASMEDDPICTYTRSKAWALGSGAGVVQVEARSGSVSLSHLKVIVFLNHKEQQQDRLEFALARALREANEAAVPRNHLLPARRLAYAAIKALQELGWTPPQ